MPAEDMLEGSAAVRPSAWMSGVIGFRLAATSNQTAVAVAPKRKEVAATKTIRTEARSPDGGWAV